VTQRGNRRQETFFCDDDLVKVAPLRKTIKNWDRLLASGMPVEDESKIKRHSKTGRLLGDEHFIETIVKLIGRRVRPQKPGPKPKR
jgi:putative transposase